MHFFSQDNQRYENTIATISNIFKIMLYAVVLREMVDGQSCRDEPRCTITRSHGLKTADCYDRDFKVFPKCVVADVEVLELSYNRLKRLTRSELSRFSGLCLLYLSDNSLYKFEEDAFDDLKYLIVLDLSLNAITKVPANIFQLPSLERLYLRRNQNMNLNDALDKIKIISSPLKYLDISFTTDEDNIPEFPDLRILPLLRTLNVTNNRYSLMKPRHIAGLCKMSQFASENVSTGFDDPCDCWKINHWLRKRSVVFTPFTCPGTNKSCKDLTIDDEDMVIYNKCIMNFEEIENAKTLKRVFIGLGSTVVAVLVIIILLLIVYRKRCFKKRKKEQKSHIAVRARLLNESNRTNAENIYVL